MLGQRRRRWANIETALCEYTVFDGKLSGPVSCSSCRYCPANTTRQRNAGSTPDQRRRLWQSTFQHWTVLSGVSTEYKLTPIQCLLNVGPASPVLGSIHSALVSTSCWRYQHDALNQSWVNVGPPSVQLAHIQRGACTIESTCTDSADRGKAICPHLRVQRGDITQITPVNFHSIWNPRGTQCCSDIESTSMTMIQRRNNVKQRKRRAPSG